MSLEKHKSAITIGIILIIVGFVLIAIGISIQLPNQYQTFLGIPYAVNGAYAVNVIAKLFTMIFGFLMLGFGSLAMLYPFFTSGKRNNPTNLNCQTIPPPPETKLYCISCGTENPYEATFCNKCGKTLLRQ